MLRGQFRDASPVRFGLRGDLALVPFRVRRHRARSRLAAAHAPRRAGVEVAVSTWPSRTLASAEAGGPALLVAYD